MAASITPVDHGWNGQKSRSCTVAIAARHPLVRAGVAWAAAAENGFRVVESVESAEDLARPADLVVAEFDPLRRPPCAATLARLARTSKVLLLVSASDPATRELAADTGAHLVVEHDAEVTDLVAALRGLAAEVEADRPRDGHPRPHRGAPLSRREIETMRHIGAGLTYRQVARRMGLSEATVGTYARRIREKLNAATKVEMVVNAMEFGYVARPGGHRHGVVLTSARND
ncbi:DNA-binding response regulator, NarL/FixJ family, contains REC and HTH domains [Lentzea fradiae]|uniref:DNA-binding response regulator, NarL/FixJ family, contains REC and HTH domains n=1 Tax=Lentzea fradiae TaxID=200378 RepID=A0A1G7VIH4_9PSEU|nr:response regulator transcription factor [Lentzea fradiae]SDG59361.1 DNA-binding response regulator, NarL/FixJ family, contains REC and HTH domains [Lentzea fradiae]